MNQSKSKSKSKGRKTIIIANNNKSSSKSRKISQKKNLGAIVKKNSTNSKESVNIKTYRDLTSPKTIEYSKSKLFI